MSITRTMLDLGPHVGQLKREVLIRTLRWAASADFATKYLDIWAHLMLQFAAALERNYILKGVSAQT